MKTATRNGVLTLDCEGEIHGAHTAARELSILVLLGRLGSLLYLLLAGVVAPQVRPAVDAGDVEEGDTLERRPVGEIKGAAVAL